MRIGQIPGTRVPSSHVEFHPGRAIFLQMFLHQRDDLVAVLVRDETESELGHRLASNYRLGPLPLVTAANPLISAVGRAQIRSIVEKPFSPNNSGTPVSFRISSSMFTGILRHISRSQSSNGNTSS